MRDGLFRGKIIGSQTGHEELDWAFGNLVEEIKTKKTFIIDLGNLSNGTTFEEIAIEVIPETVGQSTGMQDKNGVEIFKHDRVIMHYFYGTHNQSDMGYVESECELTGIVGLDELGWYTLVGTDRLYWVNYLQEPSEELEVIGNILDNKELAGVE